MWLVLTAMRRPITILVAVISLGLTSIMAIQQMKVDIFPKLGAPAIYVAQPFGGMDPSQMEGYLTYYYEYHFLYITGIEHVESKNIQGIALMKLVFHPDTDMSQAMGEVVGYVNRARAFMPPGAVPPFIMRFDAGSVPVAQLVFSSTTRSVPEMQDIALNRVRPIFATLPGVSAPPPFGGSQRTIVVRVDPERLRQYRLSPDEDVKIDLVFDQSRYVVGALNGLIIEALIGALLTGLMVLIFLRDFRSSLIVVITIPFSILSAVVCLWVFGQTINIMTLGGLALAVGVLVDEATVSIESIHTHLASGMSRARGVLEASRKTALPRLLAMLCVLSVFLPSLFMAGIGRQLFVPLSLAVGFAMVASYLLSSTLVPVLSTRILRAGHYEDG